MTAVSSAALRVDLMTIEGRWLPVGWLERSHERTTFVSFDGYWDHPRRPLLGQVFEQRGPTWRPSATTALPTWFSNLLPEGPLRQAIADDAGISEKREFFLLARIGGDDLPGAIRVVPIKPGAAPSEVVDDETESGDAVGDYPLKFSLAGVQLKFSVVQDHRGLTLPAKGEAGNWIVKLPDSRPGHEGVPENEFAALELARTIGIEVPETRLVKVSDIGALPDWAAKRGGNALLIERFDRRPGGRVHVEELSQVLNLRPARKYEKANFETVGRFVSALAGPEQVGEVIRRIVLNVLIGNGDAHVKNWAFIYRDGRNAELAPAYDIVPTVLYLPDDDLGLNLNGTKAFEDVDIAAFQRLADKAGWDGGLGRQHAIAAVEQVIEAWPVLTENLTTEAASKLTQRRNRLRKLLP